ncbi:nitric oxide synthase oxygenase [Saccharopolyspora erythraea]|uniref:nitric oxide synthase oxygenase n=1 Tax=Saccharopolyspora erythraea TaxID=1836 RepID=UPI0023791B34|nr:nitric oxide synthase oxygenase [Saccharopolyspora erythraea]
MADRIGLDTTSERTLWRDRAIVEINRAVLYSFDSARVTITDHHSETLHRLAWLRTAPEEGTERPAFVAGGEADRRARKGAPACFPLVARTATARATGEPG